MRIERAIDAFLDWRRLERDGTPRSVDSYRRILWKLAEAYPESRLGELTTGELRAFLAEHWRERSASTRSNVISVLHSFFAWAEAEDLVELDPSRKIRSASRTSTGRASTNWRAFEPRLSPTSGEERAKLARRQLAETRLWVRLRQLPEDSPVRID